MMLPESSGFGRLVARIEVHKEFAAHIRMRIAQLRTLWWREALGEEIAPWRQSAIDDAPVELVALKVRLSGFA